MRCLVLSGGGAKGAYEAGAVRYLMGERERTYEAICGISVGALNAAFLCQYRIGDEKQASDGLQDLWKRVRNDKVWRRWCPFGKLHALWGESALDSRPLHETVRNGLDRTRLLVSGRKLRVGSVSLRGAYRVFKEDEACIVDAVLASCAVPAMFLPVEIDKQTWVDGAIREDTPIAAAIDLGADEIDVIVTSPEGAQFGSLHEPTGWDVLMRAIDIMADEVMESDIKLALLYNRLVDAGAAPGKRNVKINLLRPREVLTNDLLDFDPQLITELLVDGYHDAKLQAKDW